MCNEPTTASTPSPDPTPMLMTSEAREATLRAHLPSITDAQLSLIAACDETVMQALDENGLAALATVMRAQSRAGVASSTLSSFRSTDEALAKTMQDLIETTKTDAGAVHAPTLRGMLSIGSGHLPPIHAPSGLCTLPLTDLELGMLPLRGRRLIRHLSIDGTGLHLALTAPCEPWYPRAIADGCLLTWLHMPDTPDYARLHHLWSVLRAKTLLRCVIPVQHGTLAAALLDFSSGCMVDPSLLSPDKAAIDALDTEGSGYLLVADEDATRELLALLRAQGFDAVTFARVTKEDANLTLIDRSTTLASLPMTLLRDLGHPTPCELELTPRTLAADTSCNRGGRLSASSNWEKDAVQRAGEPVAMGDAIVLHTTLPLHDDLAPVDVQSALMQGALRLVAAGGDLGSMTASIALCVSENDTTNTLWAAALGWRHAVRAWDLPTAAPIIVPSTEDEGTLTISLIARAEQLPAGRADCPVCLRLFAVETDANSGLPHADELRAMLALTSRTLTAGHVVGLRPLWGRPLGEVLSGVKDFSAVVGYESITCDERRVFGLLVRSDEMLKEGVLLGTLPPVDEVEENEVSLDVCSLIHRPTPRVLLPIFPDMDAPAELLVAIRRMGAEPHTVPVSLTHQGCTALADAILADDILLFNMDENCARTMLSHRRVAYALKTRMVEHATLFALHGAAAAFAESPLVSALIEADAPDLALRLVSAPEGLERAQLARAVAYYR